MGLFTLRKNGSSRPLFGWRGFGQAAYPLGIAHGESLSAWVKFTHLGPAERVWVDVGVFTDTIHWSFPKSVDVTEDRVEKTYEVGPFTFNFNSGGLPHCSRIDTYVRIYDSEGTVWPKRTPAKHPEIGNAEESTEKFHNVIAIARMFEITSDRYESPAGIGDWKTT